MTIKRPTLLVMTLCTAFVTLTVRVADPATSAMDKKPNILVIWGDDIGVHNISAYNHGIMGYRTPNIDRIAKEGHSSPTPMRSKAARPAAHRSSSVNTRSARVC